jgi:transposase
MASTVPSDQKLDSGSNSLILRTDTRGHVRTPRERREALLTEFDGSGLSGKEFARLSGVKYSTFQYWLQCRKDKPGEAKPLKPPPEQQVTWLEAVVQQGLPAGGSGLLLQLPGGVRAELSTAQQIHLAAALVRALEKSC